MLRPPGQGLAALRAAAIVRPPMPLYDLVLVLDPNAPEGRGPQILDGVRSSIEADGSLIGAHDWGQRRLAYEIDHREDGDYHLFQFEAAGDTGRGLLERLSHTLRIADGVLRFRIIRVKSGTAPPPAQPGQDARRDREEPADGRVAARAAADAPRG
jgi:small subunit ribosomal protein S6